MTATVRSAPILSRRDELTTVQRAAHYAGRSEKAIREWCHRYGIGRQSGNKATIEVNLIALEMVLHGDWEALELLRAGQRDQPAVARYYDHLGIAA